jgi:dihydrofolate synthase/folylpolyglutamate synthase
MEYFQEHHAVLDVAHNADGFLRLFDSLKRQYPKSAHGYRIVCGLSKTKEIAACLDILHRNASHIHFVAASNGRGMPTEALQKESKCLGFKNSTSHASVDAAIHKALSARTNANELIVICGSFFIMSDALQTLEQG